MTLKIHFTKMSGAGNDFVVVDNRLLNITDPTQFAQKACHRRFGIGADGLLLLEKSSTADFMMKYYNADGSYGGMCGNGGRCIAKFAFDIGVVSKEQFSFEALGHIYKVVRHAPDEYELLMKDTLGANRNQSIQVEGETLMANFLDTGAPHSIIFLDDNPVLGSLESTPVFTTGRQIRYHKLYQPNGTNVNFVSKIGDNSIKIRTYERGVEEETLACGTGSIASAIVSSVKYGWTGPVSVGVQSGEKLQVSFRKNNNGFSDIKLRGNAKITFEGNIDF